jgi:hypothetical protein
MRNLPVIPAALALLVAAGACQRDEDARRSPRKKTRDTTAATVTADAGVALKPPPRRSRRAAGAARSAGIGRHPRAAGETENVRAARPDRLEGCRPRRCACSIRARQRAHQPRADKPSEVFDNRAGGDMAALMKDSEDPGPGQRPRLRVSEKPAGRAVQEPVDAPADGRVRHGDPPFGWHMIKRVPLPLPPPDKPTRSPSSKRELVAIS